jgi:hypothetical protein
MPAAGKTQRPQVSNTRHPSEEHPGASNGAPMSLRSPPFDSRA